MELGNPWKPNTEAHTTWARGYRDGELDRVNVPADPHMRTVYRQGHEAGTAAKAEVNGHKPVSASPDSSPQVGSTGVGLARGANPGQHSEPVNGQTILAIRKACLEMADRRMQGKATEDVVTAAKAFERYIMGGS